MQSVLEHYDRLKSQLVRDVVTGCLVFTGRRNRDGYGYPQVGKRQVLMHRLSWEAANGPIPDGMCVLHKCDNPPCCEPSHLFLGTTADNNADMHKKGRYVQGEKHRQTHAASQARGTRHGMAKLDEPTVREVIRATSGGEKQRAVAERLGVSEALVSLIVNGKVWKHIEEGTP